MIKNLTFLILSILVFSAYSQNKEVASSSKKEKKRKVANILAFVPAAEDEVNGLALGWAVLEMDFDQPADTTDINGIYINASPLPIIGVAVFLAPYAILSALASPFQPSKKTNSVPDQKMPNSLLVDSLPKDTFGIASTINGLAISFIEVTNSYAMNGVQISAFGHGMNSGNGLSLAGLFSDYKTFKGVQLSGLANIAKKSEGLQIALINGSEEMNGLQIGLWNKIGKRALPLINFNFKKQKNKK